MEQDVDGGAQAVYDASSIYMAEISYAQRSAIKQEISSFSSHACRVKRR